MMSPPNCQYTFTSVYSLCYSNTVMDYLQLANAGTILIFLIVLPIMEAVQQTTSPSRPLGISNNRFTTWDGPDQAVRLPGPLEEVWRFVHDKYRTADDSSCEWVRDSARGLH